MKNKAFNKAGLRSDFFFCSGLMIVTVIVAFMLSDVIPFGWDWLFVIQFIYCFAATAVFYLFRGNFKLIVTTLQIFVTSLFSFLTVMVWSNPAALLYLRIIFPLYFLFVLATPISFVVMKHLTDAIFWKMNATPRRNN